ncbi:phage baseplate assembly protein V [Leptolyngbyaceae cyanobacterium UHCC 1019]
MQSTLFEIPTAGTFNSHYLAEVVSVDDPLNLARVQVRLFNFNGVDDQNAAIWARVAVPFAGANRGAFLLPDVGDEVLINFVNGDPRLPIVVGSLWNGNAKAPERLGGDRVDRWTLVGKAGTRIAIVEESAGTATISFETPNGVSGTLTDADGGKMEFQAAGTIITVDPSGVSVQTPSKLTVSASQAEVTAGMVTVNAALSQFSGVVKCDVLQATTVIASTYTPGAGNVW